MSWRTDSEHSLPGYEDCGAIIISCNFDRGVQGTSDFPSINIAKQAQQDQAAELLFLKTLSSSHSFSVFLFCALGSSSHAPLLKRVGAKDCSKKCRNN